MEFKLTPIEEKFLNACNSFGESKDWLHIVSQHSILNYRVDFLVWTVGRLSDGNLKLVKIVVECDGHDFHEKTKQQAAKDKKRDRDLQSLGFRVLRFSGSEIWQDAPACCATVFAQMESDLTGI